MSASPQGRRIAGVGQRQGTLSKVQLAPDLGTKLGKLALNSVAAWPDGKIEPGSEIGIALGWTPDRFFGWLWKCGDELWISFIESKQPGQGHFSALLSAIQGAGFRVVVPTPSAQMRQIMLAKGAVATSIETDMGICECMMIEAAQLRSKLP